MTRYRSRLFVGPSSIVFIGLVGYAYILSSLPPTFVLAIAAASVVLMLPISLISPKNYGDEYLSDGSLEEDYEAAMEREIPTVTCPACDTSNPIESTQRPLRIPCGGCGRMLRIEA